MSTFSPKKVAVLGAGVMGRQIAYILSLFSTFRVMHKGRWPRP